MFSIFRIVPQREKNFTYRRKRVIKVCDFLPHLPPYPVPLLLVHLPLLVRFLAPTRVLSHSRCLVCAQAKLLRSFFVNCFRATPRNAGKEKESRRGCGERGAGAKNFSRRGGEVNVRFLSLSLLFPFLSAARPGRVKRRRWGQEASLTYSASSGLHARVMGRKIGSSRPESGCRVPRV